MPIDLNADLGEGHGPWRMGDDETLVAFVTSANVACGFHAGDPTTARRTCRAAATAGTAVGAHVGYHDLVGFGRRFLEVEPEELADDVVYQVGALRAVAEASGTRITYVKPHGALYHAVLTHREQARAVVRALVELGGDLPLVTPGHGAVVEEARAAGVRVVAEAFADRAYRPDGTLVPRRAPGSVLDDPAEVARRVVTLATEGTVRAVDGSTLRLDVDTVCLHGDSPGAVETARAVRSALDRAGVPVRSFT